MKSKRDIADIIDDVSDIFIRVVWTLAFVLIFSAAAVWAFKYLFGL